jgi:hypothetical protein
MDRMLVKSEMPRTPPHPIQDGSGGDDSFFTNIFYLKNKHLMQPQPLHVIYFALSIIKQIH